MRDLLLQALFSGVLVGAYYTLITLGLAIVFGAMKIINVVHGDLVLLGGFMAYVAEQKLHINPVLAIPLSAIVVCIAAFVVYLLVSRIREDRELNSLMLTFGLAIIFSNLYLMTFSADIRSSNNAWFQQAVVIGDFLYSSRAQICTLVGGIAATVLVWLWLSRSRYGIAIRAVSSNREAAMLMGMNPRSAELLSFLIAALLATVAGAAVYTTAVIQPTIGFDITIKAFVITVLAGLGSVPGIMLASMLIGVAEALTATFASSALQDLIGFGLFLVVLVVRPAGLFGASGREA